MSEQQIESRWVLYSCKGCGVEEARVEVRARRADEDAVDWLHDVAEAVGDHHRLNFPRCSEKHCDVLIPLEAQK